jgi:hypothetical protein
MMVREYNQFLFHIRVSAAGSEHIYEFFFGFSWDYRSQVCQMGWSFVLNFSIL